MSLTLPLVAALALQASSPDFFALGLDHARFARELQRAGYADLAETFCARVEKHAKLDEKEAATLRSVHLDLQIDIAGALKDPVERKDQLAALLKAKVDFIEAYPGSPEAKEAEQNLPEVYRILGEAYASALQKTEDPYLIRDLRSEGAEVFDRGEGALAGRIETLSDAARDLDLSDTQSAALEEQIITTSFNLGRTYYFHASLLGPGDLAGEQLYERCIETFQNFGLDYSDRLLNFSGLIFQGLSHRNLGHIEDALASFDECIALADQFDVDAEGRSLVDAEGRDGADIISSAVQQKMLLLIEQKRYDEARSAADHFFKTIRAPEKTDQGPAILASRMTAELESGDTEAAQKTAQLLTDVDPRGPWGARGREVLGTLGVGGAGSLGAKNILKIAESLASRKDYEQAITLSHDAAAAARQSTADDGILGDVFSLQGACLYQLGRFDEAALAYDVAVESAPASDRAPDHLSLAIDIYQKLSKLTRKDFYERRSDERIQQLATRYPRHPKATRVQLSQGQKLEGAEKYPEAADFYQRVAPDSAVYQEAQFRAGTCLYVDTVRLAKDKDLSAAKAAATKAEAQLRKAQKVLTAAADKTLDVEQAATFRRNARQAQSTLGELFMLKGLSREPDALTIAQELEAAAGTDADRLGEARSLRVRALTALGKVGEAKNFLEALLAKEPDARPTAGAAGVLARTLDQQALAAFASTPRSTEGEDLWKQAFRYYNFSIQPKLNDPAVALTGEIEKVADRFFVMGLHFNKVPERLSSTVGWLDRQTVAPEYWEQAADFYEASLKYYPTYSARVSLARVNGFLGRLPEAEQLYASVIEDESFIDPSTNQINRGALSGKPELMSVYLELGATQLEAARAENDVNRMHDAGVVFDRVVRTAAKTSEVWWQARYLQISDWMEQGEYKKARFSLRELQRTTSDDFDEGKYGLNTLFKKLQAEVATKVVDEGGDGR